MSEKGNFLLREIDVAISKTIRRKLKTGHADIFLDTRPKIGSKKQALWISIKKIHRLFGLRNFNPDFLPRAKIARLEKAASSNCAMPAFDSLKNPYFSMVF